MANITQTAPQGRTGRRFKCVAAFKFERNGQTVADYVPGLIYYETDANKGVVKLNEDKIQWL